MSLTVNILGCNYTLEVKKYSDEPCFEKNSFDGYCDPWTKKIVVCDMTTYPGFDDEPKETCEIAQKETIRHEIIHAFFYESGLGDSSIRYDAVGWAKNEEMVDWIAFQGAKIFKAWQDAGAL